MRLTRVWAINCFVTGSVSSICSMDLVEVVEAVVSTSNASKMSPRLSSSSLLSPSNSAIYC